MTLCIKFLFERIISLSCKHTVYIYAYQKKKKTEKATNSPFLYVARTLQIKNCGRFKVKFYELVVCFNVDFCLYIQCSSNSTIIWQHVCNLKKDRNICGI